ncbi:hypothetical protein ACHHYP_05612 [Achlya hypogyna]|uniref:Uncharacterized protein n=1 Tax=Achlya hypogyna TaxID=1202772 RepID=A0A1V9YXG2_ACHHY|nr:hypothetical protein ACHHYP_05612 [Achlya hypogyna]
MSPAEGDPVPMEEVVAAALDNSDVVPASEENQDAPPVVEKLFSLAIDPAWDGPAFSSMMQTDLLTYSLSVSVAPMTKAIETMGSSLQKHDDTLLQLQAYCRHLEHENHDLVRAAEASNAALAHKVDDATATLRAELLEVMRPLETRTDALGADLSTASSTLAAIAAQLEAREAEISPVLPPADPAMPQLERMKMIEDRLRDCVTQHGLNQLRDDLTALIPVTDAFVAAPELAAFKDELAAAMQAQVAAMQDQMRTQFQDQLLALQAQVDAAAKNAKARSPRQAVQSLKRAQSYNTTLKPSTLGVPAPATPPPPPAVDLSEVNKRFEQEEELLEALRQQYEALQESFAAQADELALVHAPRPIPTLVSSSVSDAVESDLQLHRGLLDALQREVTDARSKHESVVVQLRRLDPLEKQLRDAETNATLMKDDIDAQKAVAHAIQGDLRKLTGDFRAFQDNQSLMQSFSAATSGGDGPDFSQVLARLGEMRAAQEAAMDDVRRQMDKMADDGNVTQQWVHRLQTDVKGLVDKTDKHGAHVADWLERDDDDRQLAYRHAELALIREKETLQRALQVQERLGIGFADLQQHALALRKELDRLGAVEVLAVKLPEIQSLHKAFKHLILQVPPIAALLPATRDTLARIGNSIEAGHLPVEEAGVLQDKLTALLQMLHTLDTHNTEMAGQNEVAKNNMDDLMHLWNSKMHVDLLAKYTQLVKELRELARNRGSASVHPSCTRPERDDASLRAVAHAPSRAMTDGPVDGKMFETKLIGTNRRLAEIEDTLRAMSKNLVAYRSDLSDKVTASNLAKLKFQIFSELAKIHAVLGSARFNAPGAATSVVCDDTDIKTSLDAQAELIASLCSDLKQSLSEKPTDDKNVLSRLGGEDEQFSSKLESITDKVAEMFVSLEANRNATQPRHAIPTYNPAQMLDNFAQNIEVKLAESQNLTKMVLPTSIPGVDTVLQQINSIKNELNDVIRHRVAKALESIRETLPIGEETTAGGSKPVVCIACSRPVRVEPNVQESVHDRLPMEPILKIPHDPVMESLQEPFMDDYHVYRAGFRMPQHDKRLGGKNVLPLLPANPGSPSSPQKRAKKKPHDAT